MFTTKAILVLCTLATVVLGQSMTITAIQYEPVDDSKFLGRIGSHFSLRTSMLTSFSDYLMQLFKIKDAELMSKEAKELGNALLFDMNDPKKWYNESVADVYIPTYSDLQIKYDGGVAVGNLTLKNLQAEQVNHFAQIWVELNATMKTLLETEFKRVEIYDNSTTPPLATNLIDEKGYNNISAKIFPKVLPYINMINNTKGPFSLHFTLDLHGEAENYPLYENQTNVLLMGYNNQTWTLGNESLITDKQYNNSYIIYADPTVTQGNIIQFPTPANFFQPTISRPFWLGWQKVGNPLQKKVAFAYTNPRVSYDSVDRYGPPTKSANHLALLLGTCLSMLIALVI